MKKLMALIVIIMIATSYILVAEAYTNPFKFSLYNQIKLKAVDQSQMGRMQEDDDENGYSQTLDFGVTKVNLNDEMKCSASIPIAEIYTMGFFLTGVGEYGFGGDAQRTEFQTGMTNAIQVVKDYLKIEFNAAWKVRWEAREDTSGADEGEMFGLFVDYLLVPYFALSGKIPDAGISWSLSEEVEMKWNPNFWKDSDPTYQSWDGDAYSSASGALITDATGATAPTAAQDITFEYAKFSSKVTFDFEFLHWFAPENVTLTLKLANNFKVKLPYSAYLEECKELNDEFDFGLEAGLAGPKVYVGLWGETADFLNTSAPLDGDTGSNYSWEGTWIGNAGNKEDGAAWTGDWSDEDATGHTRPNLKIGFKINFSYSKEWFSFGTEYKAYETGIRKWDEDGLNADLMWVNEFAIFAKFAL